MTYAMSFSVLYKDSTLLSLSFISYHHQKAPPLVNRWAEKLSPTIFLARSIVLFLNWSYPNYVQVLPPLNLVVLVETHQLFKALFSASPPLRQNHHLTLSQQISSLPSSRKHRVKCFLVFVGYLCRWMFLAISAYVPFSW